MNPIVNPLWFYVINVVDSIHTLSAVASWVFAGVLLSALLFWAAVNFNEDYSERDQLLSKQLEEKAKVLFIALCVSLSINAFVPDKTVMYQMLVASYMTPDNIQAMQGNIVEFIKQIATAIKEQL